MIPNQLKTYLDENDVRYVSIYHSPAFSAAEVATSTHVPASGFAKTLVVMIDGDPALVVVPANRRLPMHELRGLMEPAEVRLATEREMQAMFPDCELGAMPPFGNLYHLPVHVMPALTHEPNIAFNAGTHSEIIRIGYQDFDRLVKPHVLELVST